MNVEEYFTTYCNYVDSVTAEISRNDNVFAERMQELSKLLNGNFARFDNAVTGLAGEAGEVADVWKKIKFMGLEYNDEARDKLVKELGDVCWYLMSAATALGVPLEEIINQNIEKLKSRHPHGFSSAYMQHKKGA